jgi:SpoVK/Ycf46/Vps4 family AAA+-type ATPase
VQVQPCWFGISLAIYGVRATATANKTLGTISKGAAGYNFLKGEKFSVSGEFLPATGEAMTDLFLSPKNATAARRTVKLINDKGADLENRGVLMMGPPGTGKTMLARIIMNEANCTFISVTARDFWYMGTFGGIVAAFDMARRCAPSCIFLDDVDNWLTEGSIDMLKTELDGVARSKGIVTLIATNHPETFPEAILDRPGRVHDVLRFNVPDEAERLAMLKTWLPDVDLVTLAQLVEGTKGMSGSHIRDLARFASILAEQEQITATAAAALALQKLLEQRELVGQHRHRGYEAPAWLKDARKGKSYGELVEVGQVVNKSTGEVEVPIKRQATLPTAQDLMGVVETLSAATLTPEQRAKVQGARREIAAFTLSGMTKVGRVLSAANEDRLKRAAGLLEEVLSQLATAEEAEAPEPEKVLGPDDLVVVFDDEPPPAEELDISVEAIERAIGDAVTKQINRLTGRLD